MEEDKPQHDIFKGEVQLRVEGKKADLNEDDMVNMKEVDGKYVIPMEKGVAKVYDKDGNYFFGQYKSAGNGQGGAYHGQGIYHSKFKKIMNIYQAKYGIVLVGSTKVTSGKVISTTLVLKFQQIKVVTRGSSLIINTKAVVITQVFNYFHLCFIGKFMWNNFREYEGEWKHGLMHGQGIFKWHMN